MLKGISGDFVFGFSGLDTVVYDIRNDTEVIRCDTQGGARPITFTDQQIAYSVADQITTVKTKTN